jgi:hypothetical protein
VIREAALALGWLGGFGVASARAQIPQPSLAVTAMAVASDPWFGGAGLALTHPGSGFLRLRSVGVVGRAGSELLSRGELVVELMLDPRSRGWTPVAGGGVAALLGSGGNLQGRLVILVGVEQRPAAPRGWRLEAGLGGGVRLAAGYRFQI